ncbi:hypothetical protein [Streptomyces hawaiiensis]|uniref:Uncharacterized protein n=1 Tax=Streptomyces hawaiiensis TaxID=67305 RepID=A0A6G5RBU5_9ACTN|nr:hypothetical protein [Streptomyces hawaiiensis]QCD55299.1 hypothetical protein CEB94_10795 [Streptomyces hawaiiensis]
MGIRTLLSRTAPGVALPPVPAFEAAASTVRVPVTFSTALRHATADLRQRLTARGRRPAADTGDPTVAPALPGGAGGLAAAPALAGSEAPAALTGLIGADATPTGTGPHVATGRPPAEARLSGTPEIPGKPSRPWARLAHDYLTLVLTLLPRPHPAHTTISVYITTTDSVLSGRPGGSAPHRRQGQDRRGPEPDATP